jgi:hypothetical protein
VIVALGPEILPTDTGRDAVQRFKSVTVTVYVPEAKAVAVAPVCPFDQDQVYGANPPEPLTVAEPFANPQFAGLDVGEIDNAVG